MSTPLSHRIASLRRRRFGGCEGFDKDGRLVDESKARPKTLQAYRASVCYESDGFENIPSGKAKKDCPCGQYDRDGKCACGDDWAFAPLYGDGKGNSMATMPANNVSTGGQTPSPPSGAKPGAGGVNSPSVPSGPNAGTGPLMTSIDEALDFAIRASSEPAVFDAPPEIDPGIIMDGEQVSSAMIAPPMANPVAPVAPTGVPTVLSVMIGAVHRQFSHAGDLLFAQGYMDQDRRIALSGCVGDALRQLTLSIQAKCPWASSIEVAQDIAKAAVVEASESLTTYRQILALDSKNTAHDLKKAGELAMKLRGSGLLSYDQAKSRYLDDVIKRSSQKGI